MKAASETSKQGPFTLDKQKKVNIVGVSYVLIFTLYNVLFFCIEF